MKGCTRRGEVVIGMLEAWCRLQQDEKWKNAYPNANDLWGGKSDVNEI